MIKSVFILWSGGLDSTYLIPYYSNLGYDVYTGYVNILNNPMQMQREEYSRQKLEAILKQRYKFRHLGEIWKANITKFDQSHVSVSQVPLFLTSLLYNTSYYNKVAIGYVMNDDAISFIEDIKRIWYSYKNLTHYPERFPEIEFPLIKMKKLQIYNSLPEEIRKYCTYCENPIDDEIKGFINCEECPSCKRYKREIIDQMEFKV